MLKVEQTQQAWQQWLNKLPPARREEEEVKAIRWMIEELRVSYFAQQLGTPYPISDKRILQAMEPNQRVTTLSFPSAGCGVSRYPALSFQAFTHAGGKAIPAFDAHRLHGGGRQPRFCAHHPQ